MQHVSVALIDANNLFRQGLKALFADGNFRITKEASSLKEALPQVSAEDAPQMIVVDPVGLGDVVQTVTTLKDASPQARLVLLTTQLDPTVMANAIQSGADGFLMKDMSPAALAQSLHLVMMGEKVLPSHLAALLISGRVGATTAGATPAARNGLSQREVQILRRLLSGDSNKMIANALGITEATIKVHLKSLLRKISASNRTQAAIWGLNNGFAEGDQTESRVA